MNAIEFEDWMLPDFIYDGECDLCDDTALPYDNNVDFGYCADHAMSMATGASIDDFRIDANADAASERRKVEALEVTDHGQCFSYLCETHGEVRSKNVWGYPNYGMHTVSLCTEHSVHAWMPDSLYPFSLDEFLEDTVVGSDF